MTNETVQSPPNLPARVPRWLHPCVVFTLVFLAFTPTLFFDFITYDDPEFVVDNPNVNTGLSPENVRWAVTSPGDGNLWSPLTSLSHQLDVSLFGLNPTWHHATNIFWHALAACLLFLICRKLLLSRGLGYVITMVWAIHPQKIQSVAWVSERKGVLSGALFFASLLLFCHWKSSRTKGPTIYFLSLFLFACAALAKPSVLPLPLILFFIYYFDLDNFLSSARDALRQLAPFLAIALLVAGAIVYFRSQGTLNEVGRSDTIVERFRSVTMSYTFYLKRFLVPAPSQLLFSPTASRLSFMTSLVIILFFAYAVRRFGRQNKLIYLGAIIYTLLWLPVSGIIPISYFYVADRYSYLPQIGLIIISVGAAQILFSRRSTRIILPVCLTALLVIYIVILRAQLPRWKNSETLFSHELKINPTNSVAALHYGEFFQAEDPAKALHYYEIAHKNAPQEGIMLTKMGMTQRRLNEPMKALGSFKKATRVSNPVPETWTQLLLLQVDLKLHSQAEETVDDGIENFPENWPFIMNGANFYLLVKRDAEKALPLFLKAHELAPSNPDIIRACARCYRALSNEEAASQFETLLIP